MQYSCHGENQSVLYSTTTTSHSSSEMFIPQSAGLGLVFDYHRQQSHTPLLEENDSITTQHHNFLEQLFTTAPSVTLHTQEDPPGQWQQDFLASSAPNQSPWAVPHYQQTPLLSSPSMTAGHPHRNSQYDNLPGLYSSPGTTVSTRCDTPSSVTSGAEDFKPCVSMGLTPSATPHETSLPWYSMPHSSPSIHPLTLGISTNDSHMALLASTSCSPAESSLYETSDLEHIKEEMDDTLTGLSRPITPELDEETRKIRIMEERTALKRQRLAPLAASGEKPECPKCHKLFSRKHNLRQHQLTSCSLLPQRARDFACSDCPKTFHRQTDLQRHKASVCALSPQHNTAYD